MVRFRSRPLYLQSKNLRCPLNIKQGEDQKTAWIGVQSNTVVFDCTPIQVHTHTTGMTHVPEDCFQIL